MCIQKAAQDDLLAQRRKGIGDRRVQLLKNAVGEAREAAHRHIDETGAGEGLGEQVLRCVGALIGDKKVGAAARCFFQIVLDLAAAAGGLTRAGAAENKMQAHRKLLWM